MRYLITILQSNQRLYAGYVDAVPTPLSGKPAGAELLEIEAAVNERTPYRMHINETPADQPAQPARREAIDLLAAAVVNVRHVISTAKLPQYLNATLAEALKQIGEAGKAIAVADAVPPEKWRCHKCGSSIEIPAEHPRPVVGSRCSECGAWNNSPGATVNAATMEEPATARRTGDAADSAGDEHEDQ